MTYTVPRRLAHLRAGTATDPLVYLATLPDGAPAVLSGSAALIWLAASDPATGVDATAVAAAVADAAGVEPALIRGDVDAFLAELVAAGLLEERP